MSAKFEAPGGALGSVVLVVLCLEIKTSMEGHFGHGQWSSCSSRLGHFCLSLGHYWGRVMPTAATLIKD